VKSTVEALNLSDEFDYLPVAGSVLAVGQFAGNEAPAQGVRIVVTDALNYEVQITGFTGQLGSDGTSFVLSTARAGASTGPVSEVDEQLGVGIGAAPSLDQAGDLIIPVARENRADRGDLSYFHSIRFASPDGSTSVAALTWDQRPYFSSIKPEDSGSISHARGTSLSQDGVLTTYQVAVGDTVYAIAQRFGIRAVELVYLNPQLGYVAPRPRWGETLNLNPQDR
jgi:hypothetical protein